MWSFKNRLSFIISCLAVGVIMMSMAGRADAANYIARDHLVVDLRFGVEWLRCSVGQRWNGEACEGDVVRLSQEQVIEAIKQADEQLGGNWRLPSRPASAVASSSTRLASAPRLTASTSRKRLPNPIGLASKTASRRAIYGQ